MNNASDSDSTFTVYAVCGANRAGWGVIQGEPVPNPAKSQTAAVASCPSDQLPVSGGIFSSSHRTSVNLNSLEFSLFPPSQYWRVVENNASSNDFEITPYVVCFP